MTPQSSAVPNASRRVVVIGGGVAGLATAALLAADGADVTLLEARSELGGRAGSWESDGFRFDTGPSWYLMPEVFDHFFELLGTTTAEQYELVTLAPGYRAWFEGEGEAFDLPAAGRAAREAFAALDPGAAARLDAYFDSAASTYDIAVRKFLYSSYTSAAPFLDREALGSAGRMARLMSRSLDREIRSVSQDSRIRRLLGFPAVFLGGSPMQVPALYHLMSHLDVNQGVAYPLGGFERVVAAIARLAEVHGVEIRTNARVTRIDVVDGAARGVIVDGGGDGEAPRRIPADVVVSAADLHHTEQLLLAPEHRDHDAEWWSRRVAGPGAVLAMLGVRGELPQLAHHTMLLAEDWEGGFSRIAASRGKAGRPATFPDTPSLYLGKPSATDPDVAPAGDEALFMLIPVAPDTRLGHGGVARGGDPAVEAFVDRAIDQVAAWTGAPDLAERVVVRRTVAPGDFADDLGAWSGSALGPAHTLRQSAVFRASNASRRVRGLYFAGSSTIPGIGVPMCLISAELILKRLRGDESATPLAEPIGAFA